MGKGIVFSFPGGRGYEIPLLYFSAKHYEDNGYEKVFINHPSPFADFDSLYENAKTILLSYDLNEYKNIVFIAKSIGTVIACKLKEELHIQASLILFTPIPDTLPFLKNAASIILVAASDNDRHLESAILCSLCQKENITCYIEPGVGHRMEVKNNVTRNLQVINNVICRLTELTSL